MAFKITEACIECAVCADLCPVGVIVQGEGQYEIQTDVCIECGACAAECPVEAIVEV